MLAKYSFTEAQAQPSLHFLRQSHSAAQAGIELALNQASLELVFFLSQPPLFQGSLLSKNRCLLICLWRLALSMIPRLISNFWTQEIVLHWAPSNCDYRCAPLCWTSRHFLKKNSLVFHFSSGHDSKFTIREKERLILLDFVLYDTNTANLNWWSFSCCMSAKGVEGLMFIWSIGRFPGRHDEG